MSERSDRARPAAAGTTTGAAARRCLAVGLSALALAGLAGGCGNDDGRSILLYNGQHPQLTSALVAAFERQTGIQVKVRTDDSIVLAAQILQERSASDADAYFAENSPELTALDKHGLLAKADPAALGPLPGQRRASTGNWIGVALRIGALAYNPALVSRSQLPTSVMHLTQPQWRQKIGIAPTDSDFVPLVSAVVALYGDSTASRWLAGLKRNAQIYQTDEAVVAAVNRGDVATGLINSYYWYRLRLELGKHRMHSAVHYFPHQDAGSAQNVSGAAVLSSSSHRRQAQAFLRFLASGTAQRIIARGDDFEYPARPGVPANPALPPLAAIAPATPSPAALGDGQLAVRLIRRSGLV